MSIALDKIKDIVREGLNKSLDRLNKVSSAKWNVAGVEFSLKKAEYDAVCIYLTAKYENEVISFAMFVDTKDVKDISRIMVGYAFNDYYKLNMAEEVLLLELGNIILNSILSEMSNKIRNAIIPQVPKIIQSDKLFLLENISNILEENQGKTVINSNISLNAGDKKINFEVFSFLSTAFLNKLCE